MFESNVRVRDLELRGSRTSFRDIKSGFSRMGLSGTDTSKSMNFAWYGISISKEPLSFRVSKAPKFEGLWMKLLWRPILNKWEHPKVTGQWIFQSAAAKNGRKGERITSPLRIIPDMPMFDSLHSVLIKN